MEQEADYIKQQNNRILNHCNIHLEIGKIEKDLSDHCGFLE